MIGSRERSLLLFVFFNILCFVLSSDWLSDRLMVLDRYF